MEPIQSRSPERLHRTVGPVGAALSGIGIVLGAGIYVLIGEAAAEVGNGAWLAFLIGAMLAAATGLSYAELTSTIPEAGAAAAFAEESFGPRAGFVTGWVDVLVNTIAAPAVAIGFAGYFAALIGGNEPLIVAATILVCAGIALVGIGETIKLASLFAVIEASGLAIVVVVGAPFLGDVDLLELDHGVTGLAAGAALVFFAYTGFEEIATLSEEVEDPGRNIPLALLIAIAVTSILYVAVTAVAVSVVPVADLAGDSSPLASVVRVAAGERMADVLSTVALFATFNTVLLLLATAARAMYGMSRRRLLPPVVGRVWTTRGTPWVAIAIATAIALVFGLTGNITYVAQVTNFSVFALFVVVNASVIRLRHAQPDRPRPFRLRPSIGPVPVISAVGLASALLLSTFMDRAAVITGGIGLLTGLVASFVLLRSPSRPRPGSDGPGAAP